MTASGYRIPYYMICNTGTFISSARVQWYPYHLVLAQQWESSKEYRQVCQILKRHGARLILDNGAHEGVVISVDSYEKITRELQPHVVVMPDLIGLPWQLSSAASLKFGDALDSLCVSAYTGNCGKEDVLVPIKFMYAPQGKDAANVVEGFDRTLPLLDSKRVCIGLGQCYLQWEDQCRRGEHARAAAIWDLINTGNKRIFEFDYHILGARWSPERLDWLTSTGLRVTGLDTIKPCHCALEGVLYPTKPAAPIDRSSAACPSDSLLLKNCLTLCKDYGLHYGNV